MDSLRKIGEFWTCSERCEIAKRDFKQAFGQQTINLMLDKGIIKGDFKCYQFCFVGVISIRGYIIVVCPKVIENGETDLQLIINLVKCLKKYANSNRLPQDGVDFFSSEPLNKEASDLALADFLISDFHKNGLFIRSRSSYSDSGIGEVSWGETIAHFQPIFSKGVPLYTQTINTHSETENDHIITEIHKWAIGHSLSYSILLAEELPHLPFKYTSMIADLGSAEKLINIINKELNQTFSDRGIRLLQCFRFLISRSYDLELDGLSLFGTFRFEYVWEDICRQIFDCQKENLKTELRDNAKYPFWQFFNNPPDKGELSIRPDILILEPLKKTLFILDAKYYNLKLPSMSGAPEGASILKQFFYDSYFSAATGATDVYNAFLLPVGKEQLRFLSEQQNVQMEGPVLLAGHITFEFYPEKSIEVIFICLHTVMQYYICDKKLDGALDRLM